jgi:hypothetical protein
LRRRIDGWTRDRARLQAVATAGLVLIGHPNITL